MMIEERIQALVHKLDVEGGPRRLNYFALVLAVLGLALWYDTHCYRNFNNPEAMDAAQLARNVSEGKGFTTQFIRPFSVYLIEKHNGALMVKPTPGNNGTNMTDYAEIYGPHPDLANAPLYPLVLAGFWKLHAPDWQVQNHKAFWSEGGQFVRYAPEFFIALFNQFLLLAVVLLTFLVAKSIFDTPAAWLTAVLMLGSDVLWKFSVSGLPTLFLLVIFLGLVWCLASFEKLSGDERSEQRRQFMLAVSAGLLTALGMLTRYSFGWVIVPVIIYFAVFGGTRRTGLALAAFLVFTVTVSPWLVRNLAVSGTLFGTAGYAILECTPAFSGSQLMQSLHPNLEGAKHFWTMNYSVKLLQNLRIVLQDDMPRLGGGWMGILFLAGLLLGLRNPVARRLRYFTMMCLGVFILVSALGRTQLTAISPEMNTENPLVLMTPLVAIFGIAFFLTLLNQMNTPLLSVRFGVVGFVVALACQPFIMTLLPPRPSPSAFPPYAPTEIQKFGGWMRPDELVMSDIPWAMAWYGDRQCAWTTINSDYEFFQFYDYVKPVSALYLTAMTLDARLYTDCFRGGADSWGKFIFKIVAANEIPPQFPLKAAPYDVLTGLFLTDHQRWESE